MRLFLPALLAIACTSEPPLTTPQAPPPGTGLTLSHTPLVIGSGFSLRTEGAQPGETVRFAFGRALGSGPCPAGFGGLCLDVRQPSVLGTATANAAGIATLNLTVPTTLPEGATAAFQAIVQRGSGGIDAQKSLPVLLNATHLWRDPEATEVWIAGLPNAATWQASPSLAGATVELWGDNNHLIDLGVATGATQTVSVQTTLSMPIGDTYQLRIHGGPGAQYQSTRFSTGAMVGFRWTGSEQVMVWFDPLTGADRVIGTVGDLYTWSGQSLYDPTTGTVFVPGRTLTSDRFLYQLDAWSGELLGQLPMNESIIGEHMLDDGNIAYFRWNGSQEELVIMDPWTGLSTVRGTVGDLSIWSGQALFDEQRDAVWVLGDNATGDDKIWGLSLSTGALILDAPMPHNLGTGLQVEPAGTLLGARWNGTAEEVVRFDPTTQTLEVVGQLGDLAIWSGATLLHPTDGRLYAWGRNGTDDKLWAFDTRTGTVAQEWVLPASTQMSGQFLLH